jgi:hypothetical protein
MGNEMTDVVVFRLDMAVMMVILRCFFKYNFVHVPFFSHFLFLY